MVGIGDLPGFGVGHWGRSMDPWTMQHACCALDDAKMPPQQSRVCTCSGNKCELNSGSAESPAADTKCLFQFINGRKELVRVRKQYLHTGSRSKTSRLCVRQVWPQYVSSVAAYACRVAAPVACAMRLANTYRMTSTYLCCAATCPTTAAYLHIIALHLTCLCIVHCVHFEHTIRFTAAMTTWLQLCCVLPAERASSSSSYHHSPHARG